MAQEYIFRITAWSLSGYQGLVKCESSPNSITFSERGEPGGLLVGWTPEHLLLCSLASGLTLTFQELARANRFEFTDLEVEVQGGGRDNRAGTYGFEELLIRARLTVDSEKDRAAGLALLRRAHAGSMMSKAIALPQILESIVEAARAPIENWSHQDDVVKLQV